jgi:hypothetical protein
MASSPPDPRPAFDRPDHTNGLSLGVPEALFEALAERAADLAVERGEARNGGDGWLRGAKAIADYIDSPASRIYALTATKPPRIPIEHDGSALVAKRSDLDAWIRGGGGKRP